MPRLKGVSEIPDFSGGSGGPLDFPAWDGVDASDFSLIQDAYKSRVIKNRSRSKSTVSRFGSGFATNKWLSGVAAPNGFIYGVPFSDTAVLKLDPSDDSTSTFGSFAGSDKWISGVLAPNGFIYCIPHTATTILKIDPATDTASTFGSVAAGGSKWV